VVRGNESVKAQHARISQQLALQTTQRPWSHLKGLLGLVEQKNNWQLMAVS
jgi:hypothetical protein